jgi:hypothetical protein
MRPATDADFAALRENRLMSVFGTKSNPAFNYTVAAKRKEALDSIYANYGVTPEDLTLSTGANGRLEARFTPEAAKKIATAIGADYIRHNSPLDNRIYGQPKSPDPRAKAIWNLAAERVAKKLGRTDVNLDNYNNGTLDTTTRDQIEREARAIGAAGFLMGPFSGIFSTTQRWTNGLQINGSSSGNDVNSGGADYVFTTPLSVSNVSQGYGDTIQFLYDPGVLLQRADIHANRGDRYGQRGVGKNVVDQGQVKYDNYNKSGQSPYEMMFKHSISLDGLDFFVTGNDDLSERVIQILKDNGIEQINGKSLEEVIVKQATPTRRYSPDPDGVDEAYREMTQQSVEKVVESLKKDGNPAFDFKSTQDYYDELESYIRMAQDNNGFPLPAEKKIETAPAPGLASAKNVTPLFHRYVEQPYSTSKGKSISSFFVVYLSGEVDGKKRYFRTVIAPKNTSVSNDEFKPGTISHTQAKSLLKEAVGDYQLVNIG